MILNKQILISHKKIRKQVPQEFLLFRTENNSNQECRKFSSYRMTIVNIPARNDPESVRCFFLVDVPTQSVEKFDCILFHSTAT